jgi:hypothetical protein
MFRLWGDMEEGNCLCGMTGGIMKMCEVEEVGHEKAREVRLK